MKGSYLLAMRQNRARQDIQQEEKKEKAMELTDLHNRRSNIEAVAARCREHAYPLLAWPEDKALLRLSDLPQVIHAGAFNQPIAWKRCEFHRLLCVASDIDLRNKITEGKAYAIILNLGQFQGTTVAEYGVESR